MVAQGSLFTSQAKQAAQVKGEYYRTPRHIVHQLLDTARGLELDGRRGVDGLPGGRWLDAGSGDGAIWSACLQERADISEMVAINDWEPDEHERARPERNRVTRLTMDFTQLGAPAMARDVSVVVMNSPFSITHEFIEAAFVACPSAWVWSLQKQSWGKPPMERDTPPATWNDKVRKLVARRRFLLNHWPAFKLQCMGPRPRFSGAKGSDTCEYVWYGWAPTARNERVCRYEAPCHER